MTEDLQGRGPIYKAKEGYEKRKRKIETRELGGWTSMGL